MKRLLLVLTIMLAATARLFAQDASPDDLKRAVAYLNKTRAEFLSATEGLSEAQSSFKPAPARWSVAEVAEHIAAAEDGLMQLVTGQVMKAPARTAAANLREIDDLVLAVVPDRTNKRQAPEPLVPTKRFGGLENTVKHFKESRAKTLAFLEGTKNLRGHAIDSPLGQQLDAYQWVLFIAAHSERHTKQINEVKADANFPKK